MPILLPGGKPPPAAASARATGSTNQTPPAKSYADGVAEASSGSKPSPGYRRYSTLDLAFFFRAIPVEELEVDGDLVDDLEVDGDLVDDLEVDPAERSEEADLLEDLGVDEDETSACAPYLARQMSCLGSRTPGVKDTPFLGSVWGAKEADERLPPGSFVYARDLRANKHHRDTRSLPRFRPPGG